MKIQVRCDECGERTIARIGVEGPGFEWHYVGICPCQHRRFARNAIVAFLSSVTALIFAIG